MDSARTDPARTIFELKSNFLWSQVRILSENLDLPHEWKNYAVETEESDLGEKVIEDVLHRGNSAPPSISSPWKIVCCMAGFDELSFTKNPWSLTIFLVNVVVKQHNRVVYSSQAIHHVAQQIASLYRSSISHGQNQHQLANRVERTADLSRHILPLGLEFQDTSDQNHARYKQLRDQLTSLDQIRQQRQRRLNQVHHLRGLVRPFEEPQTNIQPNLVLRDSELVQEVEKMRMLTARLGGRIAQRGKAGIRSNREDGQQYLPPGSDQRLALLLDSDP
ncbi:Kinetochore Sim4 complex subunit Fta4 [Penicillium macrosclerotiorum]|uniref:Kinetochore Sim4 complex subunit Fta4 n=1 Tax=Penicillium macrosclerotiorum TaxID=303699 RepID=UPI002546BE5D|nr:Kinetochore Sim4 complex subunit Fta4 [Penicillium macrosclerotiorum]KAJ5682451.1 Kinetochore Sim4 complex subunit Fta4 [Penicillium macrosclerotiorum]